MECVMSKPFFEGGTVFKKVFKVFLAGFFLALALLLAGASWSGRTAGLFGIKAEAASLSKKKLVMVKGMETQLTVKDAKQAVVWSSTNKKIATVTSDGVVTARRRGSCRIIAKVGARKLRCKVNVRYAAGPVNTKNTVKGIDISAWQGRVNFRKIRKSGVDFVIIRIGHGNQVDSYFASNYRRAKKAGLKVGGYWYSTAMNKSQAVRQRKLCMKKIRGKTFEFPIFIDIEHLPQLMRGPDLTSMVIKDFCTAVKRNGKIPGFYTSRGFIGRYVSSSVARDHGYFQWIAEYGTRNNYGHSYNMWQHGAGNVSGVNTLCDLDFYFPDEQNSVG